MKPREDLFTTYTFSPTSKRLTMLPVKYKLKEERRKVLKISINKLKKIDDPESWLCRSVLINNTMKKLQKEAREEKLQKQLNTQSRTFYIKTSDMESHFNNNNNNGEEMKVEDADKCLYRELNASDADKCLYRELNASDEFEYQLRTSEPDEKHSSKFKSVKLVKMETSLSGGVPLNEDFVEKIPSIKRCASRKRSLDEDGSASEVLNLSDTDLTDLEVRPSDAEDGEDVHDVLKQLYLPPTPRMVTSIDSDDTDEDELQVVDLDASYIDNDKHKSDEPDSKKCKYDNDLLCFNVCDSNPLDKGTVGTAGTTPSKEVARTSGEVTDVREREDQDDEMIELEDEEDIQSRLSQSLSHLRTTKTDKTDKTDKKDCFFEETTPIGSLGLDVCEGQYSCGHASIFNEIQSLAFHNLIASLET